MLALVIGSASQAATLLEVSDPTSNSRLEVSGDDTTFENGPDGSLAVSFTLDSDVTDFSVDAHLVCLGCVATVWLYSGDLNGLNVEAGLLGTTSFDGTTDLIGQNVEIFSLDPATVLDAGTYHIVFEMESGDLDWFTNDTAGFSIDSDGASHLASWITQDSDAVAPFSDFDILLSDTLLYRVNGEPVVSPPPPPPPPPPSNEVPLPASAWMLLLALAGTGLYARRRG